MTLDEKLEEMRKASQNSESKQDLGESSQDSKVSKVWRYGVDTVQERWLVVYKRVRVSGERNRREPSEICEHTGTVPGAYA